MIDNPHLVDFLSESQKKRRTLLDEVRSQYSGQYSDEVKKFAITLAFHSRRAYLFVRRAFSNALPHTRTIARWHEKVDGFLGFARLAIPIIKKKIEEASLKGKKLKFSLQMDGMYLRAKYTVNAKGNTDGNEDFGNVQLHSRECSDENYAKESLTFLITCVNERWKMPVAYFLISNLDSGDQAFIVEEVLYFLESNGIDILSLTFDGTKSNIRTAKKLGVSFDIDDLKPYLYSLHGAKIFVILDICHMIKLIRKFFTNSFSS